MRGCSKCCLGLAALALAAASCGAARAADEEIQVYENDMDKKGQVGLDIHLNDVFANSEPLSYAGEQRSANRIRITPEWSYGLTQDVELGLYLPLATYQGNRLRLDGVKARVKYIVPKPEAQDWYWGVNFEIGAVNKPLDINPWNAEAKGIIGWRRGPWDVAVNTNIDFVVSGPQSASPSLQLATKVAYKVREGLALGVESYDGAGDFAHPGRFAGSGHAVYATADASIGKWDMNLGIGHGYSGEGDRLILKMVVSVPIDG